VADDDKDSVPQSEQHSSDNGKPAVAGGEPSPATTAKLHAVGKGSGPAQAEEASDAAAASDSKDSSASAPLTDAGDAATPDVGPDTAKLSLRDVVPNPYGPPDQSGQPSSYGRYEPPGPPAATAGSGSGDDVFRRYRPAGPYGGPAAGVPGQPGSGPPGGNAGSDEPDAAAGQYRPPDPYPGASYPAYPGSDPYGPAEDYNPADPYGPPDPYSPGTYSSAYLYGADPFRQAETTGQQPPSLYGPPSQAGSRQQGPPGPGGPAGSAGPAGPPPPPAAARNYPPGTAPAGAPPEPPTASRPPSGGPPFPPAPPPGPYRTPAPPGNRAPGGPPPPQPPAQGRGPGSSRGSGGMHAAGAAPQPDANGAADPQGGLTPEFLLPGRRRAPDPGWRRVVYHATGGLMRVPSSSAELRRRDMINRARTPVAGGHHRVAILSLKGGVGKTTTTVGLGATLASLRGDRVIAVDANPDRGTLSDKVRLETAATVRDLLNERGNIRRYADVRTFTSQAPSRLEVLASDRDPGVSVAFSDQDYTLVAGVLEHYYSICLTDCGTGLLHSAMSAVLRMADQIILVSTPSVDGARSASATLDWLAAHSYGDLVRNGVVVLSSVRPRSRSSVDLDRLEEHFAGRSRAVVRIPYDPHLEEGAEVELDLLSRATADAYLALAAVIGDGLATPARSRRP
jgi:MinD-like ATPase involved in chromosome partitioning or flagellar assembly